MKNDSVPTTNINSITLNVKSWISYFVNFLGMKLTNSKMSEGLEKKKEKENSNRYITLFLPIQANDNLILKGRNRCKIINP